MTELQGLQLSLAEFRAEGASVVAICVDSPEDNRGVIERLGLGFPILSDPQGAAMRAFDVLHAGAGPGGTDIARPATFIAADGVIAWRDLTDNYRVRPRPEELLRVVRSLRAHPD